MFGGCLGDVWWRSASCESWACCNRLRGTLQRYIQVYDYLFPDSLKDFYELTILGRSGDMGLHPSVPFKCKYEETAVDAAGKAPMSFFHVLKSSAANSEHFDKFFEIPRGYCKAHQLAARIYLVLPYESPHAHGKPHVDFPFPHLVLLYYVNDADGNTVFFDHDHRVVREVEPRKGRLLVFDGALLHGGGIPRRGPRCVVNFNLLCQPKVRKPAAPG